MVGWLATSLYISLSLPLALPLAPFTRSNTYECTIQNTYACPARCTRGTKRALSTAVSGEVGQPPARNWIETRRSARRAVQPLAISGSPNRQDERPEEATQVCVKSNFEPEMLRVSPHLVREIEPSKSEDALCTVAVIRWCAVSDRR